MAHIKKNFSYERERKKCRWKPIYLCVKEKNMDGRLILVILI